MKNFYSDKKYYKFFKSNAAWRQVWRHTYGVYIWRKTNSKAKLKDSHSFVWGRFHNCLIKIKSDPVYSQLSKRHGRFTPKKMYSKDQLKCPFSMDVGLTYADTGSTEVRILQLALGMDKHLCTLHIMF